MNEILITYCNILLDQASYLYCLIRLDPWDPLLHQVSALHVEVEHSVLRLHLPCRDDFGERVVQDGLVGDQIKEVNPMLIQCKNVLTSFNGVGVTTNLKYLSWRPIKSWALWTYSKEAWSKELPLGENLQHLCLSLAGAHILHLRPASLQWETALRNSSCHQNYVCTCTMFTHWGGLISLADRAGFGKRNFVSWDK